MKSIRLVLIFTVLFNFVFGQNPYFSNNYFTFHFKAQVNSIRITSGGKDTLVSNSTYQQELIDIETGDTIRTNGYAASNFFEMDKGMPVYTWTDSTPYCVTVFKANFDPKSEEIKFTTESKYKRDVQVIRDALTLKMTQPLSEVYRRNSVIDTANFQSEYWLNKEGARFGSGKNTLLIYHTPGISSLQLNVPENELVVNLDFSEDHPFQYFPLRDSMMSLKEDLSCSSYKAGDVRKNSFSIHAGKEIRFIPRLMLNPDGFLAAHIFTEHADWTDLPTHRAVYFGSEKITEATNASGGFVKNKIPVTKSVFYSNPDKVLNSDSKHNSIFKTPIASIKSTPGFSTFLNQLYQEGSEICLHTPDQYTSKSALVEDACEYMEKNFHSVTWIDHGYNNGPKNNREAFVCDGLNKNSSSYASAAWKKHGVKYFWNSYYEDFVTADSSFFDFYGSPMHPYPGFGDAAPQPLYWRHPTRTDNFISWPTRDLLEMHDAAAWSYHFNNERLNDFVHQRAVKFEHCYPAGSIPEKGYWKKNERGEIVVEPEFDKFLAKLSAYRDSGWINSTTVRNLLDYWIACENLSFEYTDSNSVIVTNQNETELKGVALAVKAGNVISEKKMEKKFFDGDLIFWFDMKAGESVKLIFTND